MTIVQPFPEGQIEALAKMLGDCGTSSDISRILDDRGLVDLSGHSTKWRRLYWVFLNSQKETRSANQVLDFIQAFLTPTRFVGRINEFNTHRLNVNIVLAFSGMELGADGLFRNLQVAKTLEEAEKRVRTIRAKFQGRSIHPEVLKYCRVELLQDNYFHAVFEATKGLAQRIRELSGIQADGAALIDRAFAIDRPILAINTLRTDTEKSEHKALQPYLRAALRRSEIQWLMNQSSCGMGRKTRQIIFP